MDVELCPIIPNGYHIEYNKRDTSLLMQSHHYHEEYEIYYQLSGERYYFLKSGSYYIKKGTLVLINTFEIHKTSHMGTSDYERILLNFSKEYLEGFEVFFPDIELLKPFDKGTYIFSLSPKEQFFVESVLRKMLKENNEQNPGYCSYFKINLIQLLIFISRLSPTDQNNYLDYPSSLHKKISDITAYINSNYQEDLSLQEIATQFNFNHYYLSRIFKEVTGFTFSQYINTIRIKECEKLLKNTSLSILDIALSSGYTNPTHFGRIFKQILGISPSQYRKINKPQNK